MPLSIGLLGGSFNPAHAGHLYISRETLKRLRLDEVWWLVSPRNPLKSGSSLAQYEERLESARRVAQADKRIHVSDIEAQKGLRYTVDTLRFLLKRYPRARFVWLMGADNLAGFHRWKQWQRIAELVPVAVVDRAPFSHGSLRSRAALRLARRRLPPRQAGKLAAKRPPGWVFLPIPRCPLSSTQLRENNLEAATF